MTLVWLALVVVPPGTAVDEVFLVMDRYWKSELDYFRIGGRYSGWFGGEGTCRLGDILPLREEWRPRTLVLPDGSWQDADLWLEDEEKVVETPIDFSVLSELDPDCRVVAVECVF